MTVCLQGTRRFVLSIHRGGMRLEVRRQHAGIARVMKLVSRKKRHESSGRDCDVDSERCGKGMGARGNSMDLRTREWILQLILCIAVVEVLF